ncbi:MAG: D-hexose-6-phosphate mutarotase [Burkholderiaceae bacterium]|nr:D-hexose-6-phosphate mutarotase [Burkholderiaceae bacterium]
MSALSGQANQAVRGGVPVLFPQFDDRGPLKKHGFARDLPWQLVEQGAHAGGHRVLCELRIHLGDQPNWPNSAQLVLTALLTANAPHMRLQVRNTGNTTFAWTGGLHPYWATADLCASQLLGLQGAAVQDRYTPHKTTQTEAVVSWQGEEFECLYDTQAPLQLQTPTHTLQLSMTGFDQWMVWNPGKAGAQALNDMPDDDWQRFVCVEPVRVSRPSVLRPGKEFEGGFSVEIQANSTAAFS